MQGVTGSIPVVSIALVQKTGAFFVAIETKTYENGNEADRLKVLNTLSDVRFSKQLDSSDFTYDALVSKPAMKIIDIKSSADTNATRADIIEKALENAEKHSVDSKSESGIYVKNTDSGTNILVGKNGLSHGLHRNYFKNAELTSHVGDFLENAILINRHNARE